MLKNILKIIFVFVIGILGGIFAEQISWHYFLEKSLSQNKFLENKIVNSLSKTKKEKKIIIQENTALQDAVEKIENAVIGIKIQNNGKTKKGKIISGSGLIVTSDGLVVTLAKLLPRGKSFVFFADGKILRYEILKEDLKDDLSLVKVYGSNFQTCSFADYSKLRLGERVFLLGIIPQKKTFLKSVNEGIIKTFTKNNIQTNIFERPLLNGSPLFNIKGELIGLCEVNSDGNITAIPITKIRKFIGL